MADDLHEQAMSNLVNVGFVCLLAKLVAKGVITLADVADQIETAATIVKRGTVSPELPVLSGPLQDDLADLYRTYVDGARDHIRDSAEAILAEFQVDGGHGLPKGKRKHLKSDPPDDQGEEDEEDEPPEED